MKHQKSAGLLATVVFLAIVCLGLFLSERRSIEGDEAYSLASSIAFHSYAEILQRPFFAKLTEGNSSPVFYILQKINIDIFGIELDRQNFATVASKDRMLLRLPIILSQALAISLLFYFLATQFSLLAGLFSLGMQFCTGILFIHISEVRPYSLIVLLTTIQIILAFTVVLHNDVLAQKRRFYALAVTNILMSFTYVMSLPQILLTQVCLFLLKRWNTKFFLVGTILPATICVVYALYLPKEYAYYFDGSAINLIFVNFYKSRFVIAGLLTGAFLLVQAFRHFPALRFAGYYFLFTLAGCFAMLARFVWNESNHGTGFSVPARYFIHLVPVGICYCSVGFHYLWQKRKEKSPLLALTIVAVIILYFYQWVRSYLDQF